MAFVNGLSWGIAGGGAFSGVKSVLKVDLFKGLGADPNAQKQALTVDYYKDRAEDMAKLLEKSRHEINLPEVEGEKVLELQGGENVTSEMEFDENNVM